MGWLDGLCWPKNAEAFSDAERNCTGVFGALAGEARWARCSFDLAAWAIGHYPKEMEVPRLPVFGYLLALAAFTAPLAWGTAQQGEVLMYEGEEVALFSTPLEMYFNEERVRPDELFPSVSTGNWRGYVGYWRIEDQTLFLTRIRSYRITEPKPGGSNVVPYEVPASELFGEDAAYPIEAECFTGELRIPRGERVRYVHMGFGSKYARELYLKVESGKVTKTHEVVYDPTRDAYRSDSDFRWVALGGGVSVDQSPDSWIDGRFVPTPAMLSFLESGEAFSFRGIYFSGDEFPYLWIPATPKTQDEGLPINRMEPVDIADGSHVEVKGHFFAMEDGHYGLEAIGVRRLRPGETIHHPDFPEQWADFQQWLSAQQLAPAVDATGDGVDVSSD